MKRNEQGLTKKEEELYELLKEMAEVSSTVQISQVELAQKLQTRQQNVSARLRTLNLLGLVETQILMGQGRPNLYRVVK